MSGPDLDVLIKNGFDSVKIGGFLLQLGHGFINPLQETLGTVDTLEDWISLVGVTQDQVDNTDISTFFTLGAVIVA